VSLSDEMLTLIAQSPTMMLAVGSGKALEDILNKGIATADELAETIDEAVEAWPSRIDIVARMFDDYRLSVDNAARIMNSANLAASRAASILADASLSNDKAYSILTNANLAAGRTQAILYAWPTPIDGKLADILTRGASDASITANTTITGVNRYRSLSVASGVTLTVDGQPGAIIAYSVSNSGTIDKTKTGGAGGAPGATGSGPGGAGGGGLIIFAGTLTNGGAIQALGAAGTAGSTVAASGPGGGGGNGAFVRVGADAAGKGGDGAIPDTIGVGKVNGGGGGGGYLYRGGPGGDSTYTSYADYASLADDIKKAAVDWVLVNAWAKTPTTTKAFPSAYGSGGGGGVAYDGYASGGGGGGGGGEAVVLCVSLNNTGTISANGGNGGNGGAEGTNDGGGGGGGGGIVYVLYKALVNLGTLSAAGGTYGTGDYNGAAGSAGTAKAVAI